MMVADMLEALGHQVIAEARELSHALELAQSARYHIAILDVDLRGQNSFPVAKAIKARQLSFIFSSGYQATMAPGELGEVFTLHKPYSLESLKAAIDRTMQDHQLSQVR